MRGISLVLSKGECLVCAGLLQHVRNKDYDTRHKSAQCLATHNLDKAVGRKKVPGVKTQSGSKG